jgi:uncharacterized protein (TIGR02246 family)
MRTRIALSTGALLAAGALLGWLAASGLMTPTTLAQDRPAPADKGQDQPDSAQLAAVKKTAQAYAKAFNAGDAKALAALWTKDGEYVGPDGETIRGRAAIEAEYAEFFKKNPKASLEVQVDAVRVFGRHTAVEEGRLRRRLPGEAEPDVSRYSVLHVSEDDGWRMAAVREWVPDPQEMVSLKDVEWLLGSWVARSDEGELSITYAWDEDKAFLRGRYTVKRGGKVESSGTQVIGKDPAGGLRSWLFDSSGTYGESAWSRDENRWVIEAAGTLPDGSDMTAVNYLIPLGKNAFTWQSVERTAAGSSLPDTAPLKVSRVQAGK